MRVEIDLAVLGIAAHLWTSIAGLAHPAPSPEACPFHTSDKFFHATQAIAHPREEFDDASVGSTEDVGQGSLPLGLLHAEPSRANARIVSSVRDIIPSLCLQGCRPLQDRAPFPPLRVGERVEEFGRHSTGCANETFSKSFDPKTAGTGGMDAMQHEPCKKDQS